MWRATSAIVTFDNAIFDTRLRGNYSDAADQLTPRLGVWLHPRRRRQALQTSRGGRFCSPRRLADNLTSFGGRHNTAASLTFFRSWPPGPPAATAPGRTMQLPRKISFPARLLLPGPRLQPGRVLLPEPDQSLPGPHRRRTAGRPLRPAGGRRLEQPAPQCPAHRDHQPRPPVRRQRCRRTSLAASGPFRGRRLPAHAHQYPALAKQRPHRHAQRPAPSTIPCPPMPRSTPSPPAWPAS